jgi:tight adherence protein B
MQLVTPATVALIGAALSFAPGGHRGSVRLAWLAERESRPGAFARGDEMRPLGALRGVERSLASGRMPDVVLSWLARLGTVRGGALIIGSVGVAIGALVAPIVGLAATPLVGALLWCRRREVAAARRAARADDLERCVHSIIEDCRAGATLPDAVAGAAVASAYYRHALDAAARDAVGAGITAGWPRLAAAAPELVPLALAGRLATRSGSSPIGVLEVLSVDLDSDRSVRSSVATAVAGPRASALLLAGLPVAGLLLGTSLGANPAHILAATAIGNVALAIGLAFEAVGLFWTSILIGRARP